MRLKTFYLPAVMSLIAVIKFESLLLNHFSVKLPKEIGVEAEMKKGKGLGYRCFSLVTPE